MPLGLRANGGLIKKVESEVKPINYFAVESISDYLHKILKLNGEVISAKQEVPKVSWIATGKTLRETS